MNLLFDFITASIKEGSGEYQRRVFFALMERLESGNHRAVNLFALYDSSKGIQYSDLNCSSLEATYPHIHITFIDCVNSNILSIVTAYSIDCFFICCHAYFSSMADIEKLKCKVICTIHDIGHEEFYNEKLGIYSILIRPGMSEPARFNRLGCIRKLPILKRFFDKIDRFAIFYLKGGGNRQFEPSSNPGKIFSDLYRNNPSTKIITVSDCSKNALMYYYNFSSVGISVLYPPERKFSISEQTVNPQLNETLSAGKRYYLMVSADRDNKNPYKTINAFKHFSMLKPDVYLMTIGNRYGKMFNNHISLPFLSDTDLLTAYANCYALIYPSLFEGFGYPPLEAMRFGKPVLSSNATSMPEILGDAPIYFCPLYESAIYSALLKLTEDNYQFYSNKSICRYEQIHQRQISDLDTLVDMLITQ